ncbi:MAG: M15 family metallopeptidase [Beijerinckiaceae bacterium]
MGRMSFVIMPVLPAFVLVMSPAAAAERGSWRPLPDAIWQAMQGTSWHPGRGCPGREALALLAVPYRDFSGHAQTGQLVVARSVAVPVLTAFAAIYRSGFRIERMEPVSRFGGDDARSMAANNTSGFNCRSVPGTNRLSDHGRGLAIDINPVQNPWVQGGVADPPTGSAWALPTQRRTGAHPGLITPGGPVVRAFGQIGWRWGGNWRNTKDYQHFTGRRR